MFSILIYVGTATATITTDTTLNYAMVTTVTSSTSCRTSAYGKNLIDYKVINIDCYIVQHVPNLHTSGKIFQDDTGRYVRSHSSMY